MEEYISPENLFEEKEKPLTLKSLEKQTMAKYAEIDEKLLKLERNIEIIAKSLRRH